MYDVIGDILNRASQEASPRYVASRLDARIRVLRGKQERFAGYGIVGLPFASGHVLALRRFRSSSLGFGYSSVWHRTPEGEWIFYADVEPSLACTRYFGADVAHAVVADTQLAWIGSHELEVSVPAADLDWSIKLATTPATRAINWVARLIPERLWHSESVLSLMGGAAGRLLDVGRIGLHGRVPNGQRFIANPRLIWSVISSTATSGGINLGCPDPLDEQERLGDFWIPNRGIFAAGQGYFEPFDAARHRKDVSTRPVVDRARSGYRRSVVAGGAPSLD
jgi:hypothetical protein